MINCWLLWPLQSMLSSSSGIDAPDQNASQMAADLSRGSSGEGQLDHCSERPSVNGRYSRTLEVMDALKATLRDEVGSDCHWCIELCYELSLQLSCSSKWHPLRY